MPRHTRTPTSWGYLWKPSFSYKIRRVDSYCWRFHEAHQSPGRSCGWKQISSMSILGWLTWPCPTLPIVSTVIYVPKRCYVISLSHRDARQPSMVFSSMFKKLHSAVSAHLDGRNFFNTKLRNVWEFWSDRKPEILTSQDIQKDSMAGSSIKL